MTIKDEILLETANAMEAARFELETKLVLLEAFGYILDNIQPLAFGVDTDTSLSVELALRNNREFVFEFHTHTVAGSGIIEGEYQNNEFFDKELFSSHTWTITGRPTPAAANVFVLSFFGDITYEDD